MERIVISVVLFHFVHYSMDGLPIRNGFSIKFKPYTKKGEIVPKTFGALFDKISPDFSPNADFRKEILTGTSRESPDLTSRETPVPDKKDCPVNQVSKVTFPHNYFQTKINSTVLLDNLRLLNSHLVPPPVHDYKVLVATAPPNMKMGRNNTSKKIIVYVIFPDDEESAEKNEIVVPEVYFVTKHDEMMDAETKERTDPWLPVSNNRTVTGLRSRDVAKYLNFRNKLLSRYSYSILP